MTYKFLRLFIRLGELEVTVYFSIQNQLIMNRQKLDNPTIAGLSEAQILGINQFGLALSQVRTAEFGQHTLDGIQTLVQESRASGNQVAFAMLEGMNAFQTEGFVQHHLSREQVFNSRFNEEILNHLPILLSNNSALNLDEAFESLLNLADSDSENLLFITQANPLQLNTSFNRPLLQGIQNLQTQNPNVSFQQALSMLQGLNQHQIRGITELNFTRAQVETANFGAHTIDGIRALQGQNLNQTAREAFQIVQGLNFAQVRGLVRYGLTREQVQSFNFGRHSLATMQALKNQNRARNWQDAFKQVNELNEFQTLGVRDYGLTRNEVRILNFGVHTLRGGDALRLDAIRNGQFDFSYQDAFQILKELNAIQVKGITDFGLSRNDVIQSNFNETTFLAMQQLQIHHPSANNQLLYETALQLPEYQIRGLIKFGLTTEQLGLQLQNNKFVVLENEEVQVASAMTIDAISHLVFVENMNPEDAYQTAINLNSTQVIAMVDLGLPFELVQHEVFNESEDILNWLLSKTFDENEDFELPLWAEDQEKARLLMADLLAEKVKALQQRTNEEEYRQSENREATLLQTDLNEFLNYVKSRDVLGIFDGLQPSNLQASNEETIENEQANSASAADNTEDSAIDLNAFTKAVSLKPDKKDTREEDRKMPAKKKDNLKKPPSKRNRKL